MTVSRLDGAARTEHGSGLSEPVNRWSAPPRPFFRSDADAALGFRLNEPRTDRSLLESNFPSLLGPATRRRHGDDPFRMNHAPPLGGEGRSKMRARDHTRSMLRWWLYKGITVADIAVRRSDGTMIWHDATPVTELPLAWARAENVRQADIYIRPARTRSWPVVFLDDVAVTTAVRIAGKYDALVVRTSPKGGCHLWLYCAEALDESHRARAQRWLAARVAADPASTSGEHLGRLAGFRNWKRAGAWVNVLDGSHRKKPWTPRFADTEPGETPHPTPPPPRATAGTDTSPSGREWGWICGLLESGCRPDTVYHRLLQRAIQRHRRDPERYARRTIARAQSHLLARTTKNPRERGLTIRPS